MYNYRFYPYIALLNPNKITKCERIYNALRLIEPALEDQVKEVKDNKEHIKETTSNILFASVCGIYCLYDDDTLLCAGIIEHIQLKRIITMPRFRRRGYASLLVTEFAKKMTECGLFAFSPVDEFIEPLFTKLGWLRNQNANEDGTHDYTPLETFQRYIAYNETPSIELNQLLGYFAEIGVKG